MLKVRKNLGFIHSALARLRRKKTKARKALPPAKANAKRVDATAREIERERKEAAKKKAALQAQLKKVEAARRASAHAAAAAKKHPGSAHHLTRAQEKALAHHEATLKAHALMQEQIEKELARKEAALKAQQRKEREAQEQVVREAARKAKAEKDAKILAATQAKEEASRKKALAKQQAATEAALKKKAEQEAKEQAALKAAQEKEAKRLAAQKEKEDATIKAEDKARATHVDTSAAMTAAHELNKADAPEGVQLSEDDARQQEKDIKDAAEETETRKGDTTKGDAKQEKAAKESAPAPKKGGRMINTELDEIVEIVNDRQTITILSLARKLALPAPRVEYWCTKLNEKGIIKLHYPVIGPAIAISLAKKEEKKAKEHGHTGTIIRVILTILIVLLTATILWRYYGGQ